MAKKPLVQKISIKSMNQKIRRVGKTFGVESLPYKQLIADIERDFRGMTHDAKEGIIQVTQSKTFQPNEYQIGVINRVAARQGVKEIKKKALERMGVKKAPMEDIIQNVKEYTESQNKFDKILDAIYELEKAMNLSTDIAKPYNKLYNRSKGGGYGIDNKDIEYLEKAIPEFEQIRDDIDSIYGDIKNLIHSYENGKLPDDLANDVYNIKAGEKSLNEMHEIYDKMQNYFIKMSASENPLSVKYE